MAGHDLIRKRDAAQDALDHWGSQKFKLGRADCSRMVARHLRKLGHRVKLPPSGSYSTAAGAIRAMRKLGHESLADWMDHQGLERIAPSAAVVGDIIQVPGEYPLGALTVALGNGAVAGWLEDLAAGAIAMRPLAFVAAWRVVPKGKVS